MAFKTIDQYEDGELDLGVEQAVSYCKEHDLDFYKILKGVDCYFERRKRKTFRSNPISDKATNS